MFLTLGFAGLPEQAFSQLIEESDRDFQINVFIKENARYILCMHWCYYYVYNDALSYLKDVQDLNLGPQHNVCVNTGKQS